MVSKDPVGTMLKMREKYGNIIRLDLGFVPTVIFTKYEDMAEYYKLEAFGGRAASIKPLIDMVWGRTTKGQKTAIYIVLIFD